MSYGIEIRNLDNNIIIDTVYRNMRVFSGPTTVPLYADYDLSGTGFISLFDLVMAQPIRDNVNPENSARVVYTISDSRFPSVPFWGTKTNIGLNPINGFQYILLSPRTPAPSTGTYGLEIYDNSDPQNLIFSSLVDQSIEIVATGTASNFTGSEASASSYSIPAGQDINNYFVCLTGSYYLNLGQVFGEPADVYIYNGFRYDYINNKILVEFQTENTYIIGKYIL